jgi:hypothetical protein
MKSDSMTSLTDWLTSDNFIVEYTVIGTADALRSALSISPEIAQLRQQLEHGAISPSEVEELVSDLMSEFKPGEKFVYDIPLAAVAVGIERDQNDTCRRLVQDLASLRCAEMPMAIRVARKCLRARFAKTKTENVFRSFCDPIIEAQMPDRYERYELPTFDARFRSFDKEQEYFTLAPS